MRRIMILLKEGFEKSLREVEDYKVNPDAIPYINMTEDRDNVQYYVYAEFPGVKDVVGIKDVIVKYRDVEYRLR